MDSNWDEVMEKIAYRDARKDALDLERIEKLKDKNEKEQADNSFLTGLIPTTMMSNKAKEFDFHNVEKTLNRARRYSLAEIKRSNKDKLSRARYKKEKKKICKDLTEDRKKTNLRSYTLIPKCQDSLGWCSSRESLISQDSHIYKKTNNQTFPRERLMLDQ